MTLCEKEHQRGKKEILTRRKKTKKQTPPVTQDALEIRLTGKSTQKKRGVLMIFKKKETDEGKVPL